MRLGPVGCAVRTKHLPAVLVRTAHPTHAGLCVLGYLLPGWLRRTA